MKHLKIYETWAQDNNLKNGDYLTFRPGIKFKNSIYRICKYEPGDVSPYWLENILNNGDNYWSALGNDYIKISEEEAKQELLKYKYHI